MEKEKNSFLKFLALVPVIILIAACGRTGETAVLHSDGDTIPMYHARNLNLIQHPDYTEAIIRNPWDTTQILHHYILVDNNHKAEATAGATLVKVPLKRTAVFTSVHCALLQELDCQEAIAGICEIKYINIPYIQEAVQQGRIIDLGNGMAPDIERIIDLQPDALMPSAFENNSGYGRLERLGIPIIECAEYMEVSPLAQAEWMKFYGRLFGKGKEADSLFAAVERQYEHLKAQVKTVKRKPKVMYELPQSGKWFVAAGQSTLGQLYQDAGADYLFSHIPGTGSSAQSIEQVMAKALDADLWMIKHYGKTTRQQLVKDQPGLNRIKAQMWVCDTQNSKYYEETPFHPEWLLGDFIRIFHPNLDIKTDKTYYSPIE